MLPCNLVKVIGFSEEIPASFFRVVSLNMDAAP
jgi:hypothetical protein